MSHASRKVDWCLKKAKKELEEKGVHRGLQKTEPNKAGAKLHLDKAEHNLGAAFHFAEGPYSDWTASAFFYCVYHCLLAILQHEGYESRNQECTIAAIEYLTEEGKIGVDRRFTDQLKITTPEDHNIIQLREYFQYGTEQKYVSEEEKEQLTKLCKEIIDLTKNIVHGT